ncbi:MAG: Pimeloyl-ACP methyl ester carboxylesterase [Actinomycetia bacterium]|jgi:pimeloyl-ACP methyl ester carboxylesterase|nr:Pimeloyl-ACP methyl ester carboxylesterase [Actinomycetes bacterium]
MNATATTTRTVQLGNGLEITINEHGNAAASAGAGVLLLHGGAGPRSVAGLAAALSEHAYVVTPVHPGFDGTPRVPWLDSAADLADAYLDLLEELGLDEVMVIGNSLGGWIAAEMGLRDIGGRVRSMVLLNANGIRPDNRAQVTEIRGLPPQAVGRLSFFNPALRPDPAAMTEEQRAAMAANQQVLALYAGEDFMFAPKLRRRLHRVTVPVLVAWGMEDGIVPADYGRAYAAAFANGHFQAVAEAGHFPQIEQPGAVLAAIGDFVDTVVKPAGH